MKSLIVLWSKLADELASSLHTSATMDRKTIQGRCKHEGLSFLTITLPTFGKDLQKGLDQGWVDRNLFTGFAWKGGLPKFLSGFLGLVFDRSSGVLLDTPDTYAILAVRQLTLMFEKIDLPCSDARQADAMLRYIQCEKEMASNDKQWSPQQLDDFARVSLLLFREALTLVDRKVYNGELLPKHGPGSTADGLRGNAKFKQRTWTDRLEEYFPSGEYLFPSWDFFQEDGVHFLEPGSEIPVKVISVPKTQKTPRIIAMEPTAMQYAQQGVLAAILEGLGGVDYLRSFLGFDDQTPNQRMAREGSLHGNMATLDLSEASDRVSNQLVRRMCTRFPHLREALDATRSRKADVPGHGVVRLSKYASMGSALCFPIEAMVFLTIIFLGIERDHRTSLDRRTIQSYVGRVRVYGDDIIVPVEHVHTVVELLETFGFLVNSNKSFWTGRFRESCGKEYYEGTDVSVVRVRRMFPTSQQDAQGVVSIVSLRNQLFHAGYVDSVDWLDGKIQEVIKYFPRVEPSSPVLGRHHYERPFVDARKFDRALQRPLVRGYVVSSRLPINSIDGGDALLKVFLDMSRRENGGGTNVVPSEKDHLLRSGRPQSVNIKLRWASPI